MILRIGLVLIFITLVVVVIVVITTNTTLSSAFGLDTSKEVLSFDSPSGGSIGIGTPLAPQLCTPSPEPGISGLVYYADKACTNGPYYAMSTDGLQIIGRKCGSGDTNVSKVSDIAYPFQCQNNPDFNAIARLCCPYKKNQNVFTWNLNTRQWNTSTALQDPYLGGGQTCTNTYCDRLCPSDICFNQGSCPQGSCPSILADGYVLPKSP